MTCVSKIPSLRSGERSVKTKLIFECFKLNFCENYASLLIENEVRFHLFHDIFTVSTFSAIGQCRPEGGNSYTPEGTFLPRKEGSFRGRKIFVRKEAFK